VNLKFTQEYFLKVVPEWYSPGVLSGVGTLEEQICEFEQSRAQVDGMYFLNMKPGNTTVEVVKENETSESDAQEQGN
jgi:hypothetical protein